VPFEAHVGLLRLFLARRAEIVERIEGLLNAQRKPPQYLQDVPLLSRHFEECFFGLAGITPAQSILRRQLDEAHWANGFKPRETPGQHQDVIDPAEMTSRAFLLWQRIRWPGHGGRVRYAQTLFNLYLLRRLMLLAMRVWDAGSPGDRLAQVQGVLDELWRTAPEDQPVFVPRRCRRKIASQSAKPAFEWPAGTYARSSATSPRRKAWLSTSTA
jgi:hypothetical protein